MATVTYTVNRSGNQFGEVSVNWTVTGSGANPASASDFVGGVYPSGTVTLQSGQASAQFSVNVLADATSESNETFTVQLSNPTGGAVLSSSQATSITTTITNDDAAGGTLTISGTPPPVYRGQAYSFTPTVSGGTAPRTFSVTGTLPPGLSINSGTGTISGTPS